ncbi:MAG TPA: energy transducer TonB [Nitrososphaera sp.]|nr:energy transducer TonB [Nitrososphaera sp.]
MTKSHMLIAFLFALLTFSVNNSALAQKPCPFRAPIGESGLRKQKATKKVKPIYPEASLKNNVTGRVVVEILIDEHGQVPEAKVKEAPDALTGQAVVDAAKQWGFQAPPKVQGRQICYSSTLSFKFEIKDGKGKVVDDPVN